MAGHQYSYLVFSRERYWGVEVLGRTMRVDADSESSAMSQGYEVVRSEFEAAAKVDRDAWEAKRAEVASGCEQQTRTWTEGSRRNEVTRSMHFLKFPSGRLIDCAPSRVEALIDEEAVRVAGPQPGEPAGTARRRFHSEAKASEIRGWVCWIYTPDGSRRQVLAELGKWPGGVPLAGITALLNQFAAAGWVVVTASEDKGLYRGTDARDESFPARIRYLLTAPVANALPDL